MLSNTNVKQLICNDPKIINNIIQKTMILGTKSNVKDNNNTKNDTIVSFVFTYATFTIKHTYNTNIQFFFFSSTYLQGVYGLCNIYQNLTMSKLDKQKDKLKEMEVTAEQWKEFEKITNMAKSESNDIQDTVQLV